MPLNAQPTGFSLLETGRDHRPQSPLTNAGTGPLLPALRFVAGLFAIAAAYYLGAQCGLLCTLPETHVALIWPPAGVALAVLFRAGLRYWPGVLAGALVCELALFPWWVALGIAAGNTVGIVLAVVLLRQLHFGPQLATRRELYAFLVAGLAGVTVTATNGLIWRAAAGLDQSEMATSWLVWWLGDAAGVLVLAPLLLTAAWPARGRGYVRTVAWLLPTAFLSALAFTSLLPVAVPALLIFPTYMLLICVGLTERLHIGSLLVAVVVAVAVWGTAGGEGAFGDMMPMPKLLVLWALTATAALIVLALTTTQAERARAEAALAASVAEYQQLIDSTPAAILRYTAEGTLTFVNATLCELVGCRRESLIGDSVFQLIPNMPRGEAVADLPLAPVYAGPVGELSGTFRVSDGSARWYRWTAKRIAAAGGRVEFQAVGIDLTERRAAEAERAAIERKMQDTQRLEALGVLAGGVAHDFNNLLAGVLGHAELAVVSLPEGHAARDHLATVLSGVAQAGGLTRQLLAYSGKGRFLLRSLNLNELIGQTTELLRLTLPKKVQLELNLAHDLPQVTADDGQLRQILMNLIINAGEAIGDKPGTVTVTTAGHDIHVDAVSGGVYSPSAPGRFIELVVADTGCGMDAATKAKLFDPFFTTKFAGRGLGLSAVLGIIRGHGGGVRVESEPGVGTTFTVLLPAADGTPDAAPTANAVTPVPRLHRRSGTVPVPNLRSPAALEARSVATEAASRGLAIVADDEPTVRQVGELMLKQFGFEVLAAANGAEALSHFSSHPDRVKLVLLDLMMPVMDGPETLAALREVSRVPVILCSGYTAEAVSEELAGDSITAFLQKPFARAELQQAIAVMGV